MMERWLITMILHDKQADDDDGNDDDNDDTAIFFRMAAEKSRNKIVPRDYVLRHSQSPRLRASALTAPRDNGGRTVTTVTFPTTMGLVSDDQAIRDNGA